MSPHVTITSTCTSPLHPYIAVASTRKCPIYILAIWYSQHMTISLLHPWYFVQTSNRQFSIDILIMPLKPAPGYSSKSLCCCIQYVTLSPLNPWYFITVTTWMYLLHLYVATVSTRVYNQHLTVYNQHLTVHILVTLLQSALASLFSTFLLLLKTILANVLSVSSLFCHTSTHRHSQRLTMPHLNSSPDIISTWQELFYVCVHYNQHFTNFH